MNDDEETIGPTPERLAKAGEDVDEFVSDTGRRGFRLKDSPIGRLAFGKRARISGDQYMAAERFYSDAYYSGLMPAGVIDPAKERVDGGQYKDISDFRIAAQVRFEHAIKVLPFQHYMIVEAIVIHEVPLAEYAERFRRWQRRRDRQIAALETLCQGLDVLVVHYNPRARPGASVRAAHADGYRPAIQRS